MHRGTALELRRDEVVAQLNWIFVELCAGSYSPAQNMPEADLENNL